MATTPSDQNHHVTFEPWEDSVPFSVYPYVDGVTESGADQLQAEIESVSGSRYTTGNPYTATVEINDPPSGTAFVGLSGAPSSMAEGETATHTFTRTGGDTDKPLTVDIRVDDLQDFLRGNHWDTAPTVPTQVVFPAHSTSQTITLTAPDDQRDLTHGDVKVWVLPGSGYLLGNAGVETSHTVEITDNDEAQELTFDWGWLSERDRSWEAGQTYRTCDEFGCTSGPAEGFFYYEDDRNFNFAFDLGEYWPAHFEVSRRPQDTGKTATFVVRVEHNRGWESPRHADWPTDPVSGNRYQEFPLTLTGNQQKVIGRIELLDNGLIDRSLWKYSAEIKPLEDAADGTALTAAQEAGYWTTNGSRDITIRPQERHRVQVVFDDTTPEPVPEGQAVTLTIERQRGNPLEPLTVQVRTWEPNQNRADGTNPTYQIHDVVFPAVPMTSDWVDYVAQTMTLTVDTLDDDAYEATDKIKAVLFRTNGGLYYNSVTPELIKRLKTQVPITDDDQSTITLSANSTSVTEGDPLLFTLTRGNNTAQELIVGVSVDLTPAGSWPGTSPPEAVEAPSSVIFAPGDVAASVNLTPPDDWRDIPDSALTFTVMAEPEYEITGPASITVPVADNDVAPQVQISFNAAEVDEGQDLVLTITRTGDGQEPRGDRAHHRPARATSHTGCCAWTPANPCLPRTFNLPDDDYKGPDTEYEATLHPGPAEFWTPATPTTVTGKILDNDLYTVGIEAITPAVDEGQALRYRVYHDGYTGGLGERECPEVRERQRRPGLPAGGKNPRHRARASQRQTPCSSPKPGTGTTAAPPSS